MRDDVRGLLDAGRNATLHYGVDGQRRGEGLDVFVESFAPPPRMIVFGAIDFAAAVAKIGSFLGFRVTVCDARPVFATASRFPGANEVVVEWPHRYLAAEAEAGRIDGRTVLCVLTHDPKFDVPLLEVALRLPEVGLHRRDGVAAHARRPAGAAARARADRGGAGADEQPDRAGPGGAHPGGDGRVDRRGDDRHALGRRGRRGWPTARARSTPGTRYIRTRPFGTVRSRPRGQVHSAPRGARPDYRPAR